MASNENPYAQGTSGYGAAQVNASLDLGGGGAQANARPGTGGAPGGGADLIKDTTTAAFMTDVVQESRQQPVLVDFWAPWCGPCKQLTPILEKVVREAGGRVKLVKLNIDDHPAIPGQMGVQSIPAVFAFVDGQPVDGFMGAQSESQIKAFIDKLGGGRAEQDEAAQIDAYITQARERLADGDINGAAQMFNAVMQHAPDNVQAKAGMAECLIAAGRKDEALQLLEALDEKARAHPDVAKIFTRMALEEEAEKLGDPEALKARIEKDPKDFEARLDLAKILNIKGEREAAADQLLAIMRADRTWRDDGARQELITFFEAWGPSDPATLAARRKLSSILFA